MQIFKEFHPDLNSHSLKDESNVSKHDRSIDFANQAGYSHEYIMVMLLNELKN